MRIPRDLSGAELIKKLALLGYRNTRQTGSHIRLTSEIAGEHHITIPNHDPLRMGTLSSILNAIAAHHRLTREELLKTLRLITVQQMEERNTPSPSMGEGRDGGGKQYS